MKHLRLHQLAIIIIKSPEVDLFEPAGPWQPQWPIPPAPLILVGYPVTYSMFTLTFII